MDMWIHSATASPIRSYFDNVMTKFMIMINNRTDAWKTDVNLLNVRWRWQDKLKNVAGTKNDSKKESNNSISF